MLITSKKIPAALNKIKPGSTFLAIRNYLDNHQGRADYSLVFHIDYLNAVRKAISIWQDYKPQNDIEKRMRADLIDSYCETLEGHNSRSTSAHAYQAVSDGKTSINGVKAEIKNDVIHLTGFVVAKREIVPGVYPVRNSSVDTIVRNTLMRLTPLTKFRQFVLAENRFDSVAVGKLNLTQRDLVRELTSKK